MKSLDRVLGVALSWFALAWWVVLLFVVAGCAVEGAYRLTFADGTQTRCERISMQPCGFLFQQCDNGATYACITPKSVEWLNGTRD